MKSKLYLCTFGYGLSSALLFMHLLCCLPALLHDIALLLQSSGLPP